MSPAPADPKTPSLTERRKAATRMEIALSAARLFVTRGLRATRAEDIAQAAGVAPRTFYRYFATKEEAVAPCYAAGAERWREAVRTAPAALSVPEALAHAVRHTFVPGGSGVSAISWQWARTLIRLAGTSPAVRKVWAEVCQESERELAGVLAARTAAWAASAGPASAGGRADSFESGTETGTGTEAETATGTECEAAPSAIAPDLRFSAAVASAAVRVAVEAWATGDAPATGPQGPAALALRNLAALRDFAWDTP
ncbi:TetR/AcrR family transcriptional regulator [Streptomyces sp. PsTaAH-124]|uniref:TetR/AcrR family transcriptional regulator n=1 Tax=Streptomyces sp. PsTaAH-124 TaxID=1157638 RepID=UPI00036C8684|nr:TetR family transcriptional regulator [Streptomyces sp. PsTaAH-124]